MILDDLSNSLFSFLLRRLGAELQGGSQHPLPIRWWKIQRPIRAKAKRTNFRIVLFALSKRDMHFLGELWELFCCSLFATLNSAYRIRLQLFYSYLNTIDDGTSQDLKVCVNYSLKSTTCLHPFFLLGEILAQSYRFVYFDVNILQNSHISPRYYWQASPS